MKELHQQYIQIQYMPLIELFNYVEIHEDAMKEMEEDMEEAKKNLKAGSNKFKVSR